MFVLHGWAAAFLVLYCSVSLANPVGEVSDPLITPAPVLVKREPYDYSDFIGYYSDPGQGTYTASTCFGISYAERESNTNWYGGCQYTSVLSIFTSCYGNTAYGVSIFTSGTYAYTAATAESCYSTCITDILEYNPSATTSSYFIQCEFRTGITFFREPSNALPALSGAASSHSTTITSSSSTTIPFPGPTTTHAVPHPPKLGTGPIIGIVLGSLAVIIFIITIVFFILKKRQHRNSNLAAQNQPVLVNPNFQSGPPPPQNNYPQNNYPPGMAPIQIPEKTANVQAQAVPMSPYSPHQSWNPNSNVPAQEGISPPGSPPPTYFHQPQPQYPQNGYQPGPGQNFQQQAHVPGGPPPGGYA